MDQIVELLVEPMTTHEIAEALHYTHSWACALMRHMTAQKPRRVRLCGWIRVPNRTPWVAQYKAGSGRNVSAPRPLTNAEIWQRQKAEPARYAKHRYSGIRTYYRRKGLPPPPPKPASPFAALGL